MYCRVKTMANTESSELFTPLPLTHVALVKSLTQLPSLQLSSKFGLFAFSSTGCCFWTYACVPPIWKEIQGWAVRFTKSIYLHQGVQSIVLRMGNNYAGIRWFWLNLLLYITWIFFFFFISMASKQVPTKCISTIDLPFLYIVVCWTPCTIKTVL